MKLTQKQIDDDARAWDELMTSGQWIPMYTRTSANTIALANKLAPVETSKSNQALTEKTKKQVVDLYNDGVRIEQISTMTKLHTDTIQQILEESEDISLGMKIAFAMNIDANEAKGVLSGLAQKLDGVLNRSVNA